MSNSITISAEYSPGIGWQYVVHADGKLVGRYGNFDTEGEAIRAGKAGHGLVRNGLACCGSTAQACNQARAMS